MREADRKEETEKMSNYTHKAWKQYEAGKAYKNRIGYYSRVKQNEAFYRGEQWAAGEGEGLPKPVFNLIRRVVDYLVSSVACADIALRFSDNGTPFYTAEQKKQSEALLRTLEASTAYRWEKSGMDTMLYRLLTDAAISGDGALYCYWSPDAAGDGSYSGDIVTSCIDSACIYPCDVNIPDIQSQEYIIISGRASVSSLKREAAKNGVRAEDISKIRADSDTVARAGSMSQYELEDEDAQKATYIVKFWREDGHVAFEKSTRDCIIMRTLTDCTLYPIAYFNWASVKDSFHGSSPVSSIIANQKFVNRAYAMAMKHMSDTAFSKVIYDKSKIPEWTNEVGEAIAAMGGGNISDAVTVIGTGQLQTGYIELVEGAVALTKELMGATESALGNLEAKNTSAILALQESSRISLDAIRYSLYAAIEQLADIWTDMLCAYYPSARRLPCSSCGNVFSEQLNTEALRKCMLRARVDVSEVTRFSAINVQNLLDKLLDGGYITASEYISRLPTGLVMDRQALIDDIEARQGKENSCG